MRSTQAPIASFFVLSWIAVAAPSAANPDDAKLVVRVVDAATELPVPWANLVRVDKPSGFLAGDDGVFRLTRLEPGPMRFRIVHVSYGDSPEIDVTIPEVGAAFRTVRLESRDHEARTIRVRGDREVVLRDVASGVKGVSSEDATPLPNPTDDVFRMVRVLPGVASQDVGGSFHLRGGGLDETLVRLDGLEVRELFHAPDFGGVTGIIPYSLVSDVNVYLGGFPSRYGGKLSGVIDVGLRTAGAPGLHGRVGADAVSARVATEYHAESASFLVSVREGYLDQTLRAIQERAVIEPGYRDLLLRTVLRPDAMRTISVNYLRAQDDVHYEDGINDHRVDADYVDHYLWSTANLTFSDKLAFRGTVHRSRSRKDRIVDAEGLEYEYFDRVGARLEGHVLAPGDHFLTVGAEIDRDWGSYHLAHEEIVHIAADGATETIRDYEEIGTIEEVRTSAWIQDEWRLHRSLAVNVGLRGTDDTRDDRTRWSPRVSAAYEARGRITLRVAWGQYEQPADLLLRGESYGVSRSERPDLAEHYVAGIEKRVGSSGFGIEVYDKVLHQLDGVVTRAREGEIERYVVSEGRASGVELYWHRNTPGSNWWLSYALGRSLWSDGELTFSRDFDRLHSVAVSNTFRLGRNWDLGLSYAFHTGSPYTEQSWVRNVRSRVWTLDEGFPNAGRLPDYQRLDLRVRRTFRFDGWRMAVYAEALNLTNQGNVLWYSWAWANQDGSRVPQRTPRNGMPGIPSLGFEISF